MEIIDEIEIKTEDTTESLEFQSNIIGKTDFHNCGLQSSEKIEIVSNANDITDININKSIISKVAKSYTCAECKHTFKYFSNLKRHVNVKHPSLLLTLCPSIKRPHKCNVCEKNFKSIRSLQAHRLKYHKQYTKVKLQKCPLCFQKFIRRNLIEHFEKSHKLLLKPVKLNFSTYEKFCEWKKAIERATKSYFRKQNTRETNGIVHHIFICHRSGTYKSATSENKRKLKAQGSRKIDAYCPATMQVAVLKEGKCEVTFQSQHVGHENDLQHLNLTYEERLYVADKLATNLPLSDILNDIHTSASKDGSSRLCLLTKKDLYNIKSNFLKEKQFYASAVKSNKKLTNDLSIIHNKHTESEKVRANISKIEKGWVLTFSEHNEIYLIKENSKSCDCPLICSYCKVCIKSYICSCLDSSVEGNMCKHIHFFCMESNKRHDVLDNNDFFDNKNDITKINSNSKQCDHPQTNISSPIESTKRNKPGIIFVNSEKKSMLKNKFSDLVDSVTTEEEHSLFENTIQELMIKLKSIQLHSLEKGDAVIPSTSHLLTPMPVIEKIQGQQNSNFYKPLLLQIIRPLQLISPLGQDANTCYIHFSNNKPNNVVLLKNKTL